jgi:hypothetical protein
MAMDRRMPSRASIESAANDHQPGPDAEDAKFAYQTAIVLKILSPKENVVLGPHENAENDQQSKHADFLAELLKHFPPPGA